MKENNKRLYPGEKGPRPDLAKLKREEAIQRNDDYAKLSVKKKLELLDDKFGKGKGAVHQRERLTALLNATTTIEEITEKNETSDFKNSLKKHLKAKDRRKQEKKGGAE